MLIQTPDVALTKVKMLGTLTVRVVDAATRRQLRVVQKRNTITYSAGNIMRALLAQRATDPSALEYQLGSMRFGTSSLAPARSQTDLAAEVVAVRKELTDAQIVDGLTGEVELQATMLAAEGNGNTYQEAGLFTLGSGAYNDNVGGTLQMFSRQIHVPLAKAAGLEFQYSWVLQFTT